MTRVVLIQCTKSKRDAATEARDLYDSTYFRAMRQWAESTDLPWFILSAEHGLVPPTTVLEPYDAFGLSDSQADSIAATLSDRGVTAVRLCAGEKYTTPLVPQLRDRGIAVEFVADGLRIGERVRRLQTLTASNSHDTLC